MRIGIDIDGVLTNLRQFHIDFGSKYCVLNDLDFSIDLSPYDIASTFNISKEAEADFWNNYLEYYAKEEKARPFAKEIINKLKDEGNEIYIITSRWLTERDDEVGENMRKITKNWLTENEINYDKLIFTRSKLEHCKENEIGLMIEDDVNNIKTMSKHIPVICYDAEYNKNLKEENVIRCYSWYQIYNVITKMVNYK